MNLRAPGCSKRVKSQMTLKERFYDETLACWISSLSKVKCNSESLERPTSQAMKDYSSKRLLMRMWNHRVICEHHDSK